MELITPKQNPEKIVELLDHQSKKANAAVKIMATEYIKSEEAEVSVSKVEFTQMDSARLSTGAAYFNVTLKGTKEELEKVANVDSLFSYDWENPTMDGVSRKAKHNLTLRNNVSMLDGNNKKAMKKKVTKSDWTEPEWLNQADWHNLKIIKKYVDAGDFESAMNHARNCDTVIREEIPPDVWKKMGGQLTKTGEEKLKAMKQKSSPKITKQIKKTIIPFNHGVRILKGVIEREWDLELTDGDYIQILDIAQERNSNFPEIVNAIHVNITQFLIIMKKALDEWDKKTGRTVEKSREKFYPEFYVKRKDEENPGFIFSLTNTKVLTEALQGEFDLVYLVRRELANRGLDSKGKWVGFDEAKKIHRIT